MRNDLDSEAILLCEDNQIVNMYNEDLLDDIENVKRLTMLSSKTEAINFIKALNPEDAIPKLWLVDINLPDGNGFEFIDQAISYLKLDVIPDIYILTSSTHSKDQQSVIERPNITGYITKPLEESFIINYYKKTLKL